MKPASPRCDVTVEDVGVEGEVVGRHSLHREPFLDRGSAGPTLELADVAERRCQPGSAGPDETGSTVVSTALGARACLA